ncbi:MAG TPA: glycoside hydrolase family 3 N-terminal domain-containing protein [Gemmatimonadales bacterium]|nr:glycoside hydrolase family 3 N-terminal domain-containing protein [Gemmatimonadales bacterium]
MRAHRGLVLGFLVGCASGGTRARPAAPAAPPVPVSTPTPAPPRPAGAGSGTVDSLVATLDTRQRVAQLVMPWLSGSYTAFDDSLFQVAARWVDTLELGGLIISVGSPFDIAAKLNALQRRSRLPLLVSADLEWGAGMRVIGATAFPHIMAVGATGEPRDARTIGEAAALEGRAVGIHVNFAPDADLNNNPANPIINTRSFGEDPRAVSRLVEEYVRGLHAHGMLATLKHFPGHGDTQTDSHIGLTVIAAGYGRLDSLELVPFRAGIAAGADVVMSAHIAFPGLTGSSEPGTLAPAVLTGLLRDSLRFQGLVVTDALMMGAIVTKYGAGEATVRAFLAGSDLLLMPADPDSALSAMIAAVASGRIPRARLEQSVRRVLELKRRLGLFERRTVPLDSIMTVVGSKRLQDAANDVAVRALTLVRDMGGRLHALRAKPSRFALVAYADEFNGGVGQFLTEQLHEGGDSVDYFRLWPMSGPASYDSARAVIARAPTTVFVANVRPLTGRGTIALPDSLAQLITATDLARPTVLVSLGSPYLLSQTPSVKSYLIAWSGVRVSERAVALALLGRVPITGHLPIRLPPDYAAGWGIMVRATRP